MALPASQYSVLDAKKIDRCRALRCAALWHVQLYRAKSWELTGLPTTGSSAHIQSMPVSAG